MDVVAERNLTFSPEPPVNSSRVFAHSPGWSVGLFDLHLSLSSIYHLALLPTPLSTLPILSSTQHVRATCPKRFDGRSSVLRDFLARRLCQAQYPELEGDVGGWNGGEELYRGQVCRE